MDKRLDWADIARGIGIILVVFAHTLVPKLRETYPSIKYIWIFIYNFHMPLFFFISGWLFEKGLDRYTNKGKFIADKARLLMLPYIMFSLFAYAVIFVSMKIPALASVLSEGGYGSPTFKDAALGILFYAGHADQHLWFVYSLFIVFTVNILLGRVMRSRITLIILFALYISKAFITYPAILNYTADNLVFFSIARMMYSNGRRVVAKKPLYFAGATIVFAAANIVYSYFYVQGMPDSAVLKAVFNGTRALCSVAGIVVTCSIADMIAETKMKPLFMLFGNYSYDIYLMHAPFLVSGLMGILLAYTSVPTFLCSVMVTVTGILLPYLISKFIIRKIPPLSLVLLGGANKG